jgi:hypothetical protein
MGLFSARAVCSQRFLAICTSPSEPPPESRQTQSSLQIGEVGDVASICFRIENVEMVRLRLSFNLLEIQKLRNVGMHENVMAPVCTRESEPETLHQSDHIRKPDIISKWRREGPLNMGLPSLATINDSILSCYQRGGRFKITLSWIKGP